MSERVLLNEKATYLDKIIQTSHLLCKEEGFPTLYASLCVFLKIVGTGVKIHLANSGA